MMTNESLAANPYVGPRTFGYAERDLFFGREREARDLLARVLSERLLLFYAQSGAGKSSLLHTRLIPQLRGEKGFGVLPVGRVSGELPPGVSAVQNIFVFNLLLSIDQGDDPARLADITLRDFLARLVYRSGHWIYDAAVPPAPLPAPGQIGQRYALIVDQFEEIFTSHPARWAEREAFFRQLDQAMQADPNLWVVLTLREDYVAALDPYASLLADRLRGRFYMERMDVAAALAAVQEPAKAHGRPFAPGVAETLVQDLSRIKVLGQTTAQPGQYVEPVQLQVVCYQLWANLARQRPLVAGAVSYDSITAADLAAAGDVDTALARFYEETVASVLAMVETPISERQLRTWFDSHLITPTGTRGLVLQGVTETGGLPNVVVRQLQARFLVRSESRAGGAWVELVHDRFVEPIQQANRAWLALHADPLTQAAQAWAAAGKPGRLLYSGHRLREAGDQLRGNPGLYSELEKQFIQAAEQRERRVRGGVALFGVILVVLLAGLAAWGAWNASQARQNEQRAIAAAATAQAEQFRADEEAKRANQEAMDSQRARADADARRGEAERAQQAAEAAKTEVKRLMRGIRADQLTANGLKVLDENPPLALLLAVEGLRVQNDITQTVPITRIRYDFGQAAYVTETRMITTGETAVGSAQTNMHDLLGKVGGIPLAGHAASVSAVAFSPDGRWLATGSVDHTARLWDLIAANPAQSPIVLQGHTDRVNAVVFSPDGRWLATGSVDHTARLWDLIATDPAQSSIVLGGHEFGVSAISFSPDGRWLATASEDNTAQLWDMRAADPTQSPIVLHGLESFVSAMSFSPDGRWLVIGAADYSPRLWDLTATDAQSPIVLHGHKFSINAVAFSPDGRWLVTGSEDNTARLWDMRAADPAQSPIVLQGHKSRVNAVAFSPDGRWLATASGYLNGSLSSDNTARLWDMRVADPAQSSIVLHGHADRVSAVAFSPDGHWLVTGSDDYTARQWDLTAADPGQDSIVLRGHAASVSAVAFSPDGHWLATGSDDYTVRLWDMQVADPSQDSIVLRGHVDKVKAVAFSPDSRWLATGSDDYTVCLWDVTAIDSVQAPIVLQGHTDAVFAVAFSPDGRWLATGSYDRTARLWDMRSANPAKAPIILQGHKFSINAVAFSPDGQWLATGSDDGTARLWDMTVANPAQSPIVLLHDHEPDFVSAVAFSPDGHWLATGAADRTVRLWDMTAANPGQAPIVLQDDEGWVSAVAFSPDGRWLAAGAWDNTARLWDMTTADPAQDPIVLQGYTDKVSAVAFSPDGRWLAAGAWDNTARLWDMTTANPAQDPIVLQGYTDKVSAVAFSPDGRWLATASADGTAWLWTLPVDDLIDLACHTAGRNLTAEEWRRYFGSDFYRQTCGCWPVHPSVTQALYNEALALAKHGDIPGAMAKFEEALTLDPDLDIKPETEAKRIYASALVDEGRALAQEGYVATATAKFEQALAVDPSLEIEAEAKAKQLYISKVVEDGHTVTQKSYLAPDARNVYTEAMVAFASAQVFSPTLDITATLSALEWTSICWKGSLAGVPASMLPACERAIALEPHNGLYRDSRGLARALIGDGQGAIEDFQAFVAWAKTEDQYKKLIPEREGFIEDLKAGKDPSEIFTAEVKERLNNQ